MYQSSKNVGLECFSASLFELVSGNLQWIFFFHEASAALCVLSGVSILFLCKSFVSGNATCDLCVHLLSGVSILSFCLERL